MKVDKVVLPKKEGTPVVGVPVLPEPAKPVKVAKTPGLSPRQQEAKEKAEKELKDNPASAPEEAYVPNPEEGFVTLTAADPKVTLEASINGESWVGKSITVPKQFEGDVRRLLEVAGMYVKN